MRAAIMRNSKLVVDELPDLTPGPGQVLVKTLACGICGSDLHALQHAHSMVELSDRACAGFGMDLSRDIVMGHEFCVEVLDYGPGSAKTLTPGTRACSVPMLAGPDGVSSVGYSNDAPGGYGEQMLLTDGMLLPVPDGLPTDMAALTEPMAVGYHAVEKARIEGDEIPLVVGCGPVGLAVITALKLKGLGPIIVADYSSARRALAEKLGADVVIDPAEHSPYESWQAAAEARAIELDVPPNPLTGGVTLPQAVYFECVGVPGVIDQMMLGAPSATRIVVVGVCMEEDRFQPFYGIVRELNLQFVLAYTAPEFEATLGMIADGRIECETLITGKVGVEGVAHAFNDLGDPEKHAKIIVEPWR
ncbi:MAG: alcohol dehydrogenase [Gammaproteobacteria bacterium]|nr:alcohol dehydrogenase [Gammaproteobacteria bacterium]